ncbi:MAG: hypothetical protein U1E56_02630 [Bauldia sp.]
MKSRLAVALAFVVPAGFAMAAAEPAGPPKPAPEMAQLDVFKGRLKCTGKQNASDFGPAHPVKGSAGGTVGLNGFVVTMRYDENKTKENAAPIHAMYDMTYDAAAKQFVSVGFDNMGGRATLTSKGWDGDKFVLTGEVSMAGQKIAVRDTFTKTKDGLMHTGEMQGRDGKFFVLDEETCKR